MLRFLIALFWLSLLPLANSAYYKEAINYLDINKSNDQNEFMNNHSSDEILSIEKGSIFFSCDITGLNPWVLSKGKRTPIPLWDKKEQYDNCNVEDDSKLFKINEKQVVFRINRSFESSPYYITDGTVAGTVKWEVFEQIRKQATSPYITLDKVFQLSNGNYILEGPGIADWMLFDSKENKLHKLRDTLFVHPERVTNVYVNGEKAIIVTTDRFFISDGTIEGTEELESTSVSEIQSLLYQTKDAFFFFSDSDDTLTINRLDSNSGDVINIYNNPNIDIDIVSYFGVVKTEDAVYFVGYEHTNGKGEWPFANIYKYNFSDQSLKVLHQEVLNTITKLILTPIMNDILIEKPRSIFDPYSTIQFYKLSLLNDELSVVDNKEATYDSHVHWYLGQSDSKIYLHPYDSSGRTNILRIYDPVVNTFTDFDFGSRPTFQENFVHDNELYLAHGTNFDTMHAGYYFYNELIEGVDHAFTIDKGVSNSSSGTSSRDTDLISFNEHLYGKSIEKKWPDAEHYYWRMDDEFSVTPIINKELNEGAEINSTFEIDLMQDNQLFFSVGNPELVRNTYKYDTIYQELIKLYSSASEDDYSKKIKKINGFRDSTLYVETKDSKFGVIREGAEEIEVPEGLESNYTFNCGAKILQLGRYDQRVYEITSSNESKLLLENVNTLKSIPELNSFIFAGYGFHSYNCITEEKTTFYTATSGENIETSIPSTPIVNDSLYFYTYNYQESLDNDLYRYNLITNELKLIGSYSHLIPISSLHINSTGVYHSKFNEDMNETILYKMLDGKLTEVYNYSKDINFLKTLSNDNNGWLFFTDTEIGDTRLLIYIPEHNQIVEMDLFSKISLSSALPQQFDIRNWVYLNGYHYMYYESPLIGTELLMISAECLVQLAIDKLDCTNGFANNVPQLYETHDVNAMPNKYIYIPTRVLDIDDDELSYQLLGAPDWLKIDSKSGEITGTVPNEASTSIITMSVVVSDGYDEVNTNEFLLNIQGVESDDSSDAPSPIISPPTQPETSGSGGGSFNIYFLLLCFLFFSWKSVINLNRSK